MTVSGTKTLRCHAASREPGTRLTYVWKRRGHHSPLEEVATGSTHKAAKSETGKRVFCFAYASNDGGEILVGSDSTMVAR